MIILIMSGVGKVKDVVCTSLEVQGPVDPTVPGSIAFTSLNGNKWYLSVDNSGKVRISAANTPPVANGDGTVVGTQS